MRFKFSATIYIVATALFFSSCSNEKSAAVVDLAAVKTDIQAMEDAYATAEKAKDADKVAAYYSDDATSYGRNRLPEVGKAAIKESLAKRLAADTTGNYNVYKVVDLFAEGDMVVEIGSWSEMSPAGTEVDKGHYMSHFQKRDGKYVCVRDMSVSSNPVKP
jgi:ketosteroid isomerase-like protein